MAQEAEKLLPAIISIAEQAGERILSIYHTDFNVDTKADDSPLTAADRAAHQCIVTALAELTPDIPVLSEESRTIPWSVRSGWNRYWLVDPLDGTKEFIKRNGEFTVNIALIEDHQAILGVVYVPVQHRCFYGSHGNGSFEREADGNARPIRAAAKARDPVRVVGSRSHRGEELDNYLAQLGNHEIVSMGSSLKLCLVASGTADIYPRLGLTSEWDTAAAQAVVECAGGKVVQLDGSPLLYNTKDDILNPYFLVYGDQSRDWRPAGNA